MYVAVKGGEAAIANSEMLLAETRRGDPALPEIGTAQIASQLSLAVDRVAADALRLVLASRGVIVSSGSACATTGGPSKGHSSLDAIGLPPSWGMARMSFGLDTTAADVAAAAPILADVISELASRA